jgi:hypothetical protein
LIFTGFGLFAGLLAPVLLLIELFHAFDQIRSQRPRSGFKKFAMQQTPVLKYSEEPDRTPENPALRSTSEPASGVGQIGGIISALLAIAAAWALFAWNYRFDPAVPGFRFPYERPIEYLYFIGTMMGHFFGLPRATPLEVAVGLLLFTALACICIRQFVGLIKVGVVGNGRAATLFSLSAFSLIFSLHAAVGRTMLGWQTATASRYVTLMIPMAVALLIQLATTPVLARRGLLWVYCGLAAFGTLTFRQAETDGARNLHNNLLNWRAAYLQTHDQTASDRIVNFSIHPGDLSDQLRYLQARRLNLFDADEFQGNTGILEP